MSAGDFSVTVRHNSNCGTSRRVLEAVRASGREPTVVEYMKTGWTRAELERLLVAMGARPADILRRKEPLAAELGLLGVGASDDVLLEAMVAHPVLVDRPIVETPRCVRLCRPAERVEEIL